MPANTPPIEELERALSDEKLSGFGRRAEKLLWEHRHELLSLAKLALLVREGGEEVERAIRAAYIQGAHDVHDNWQEDRDPDFSEAASDYLASIELPVLRTIEGLLK